MQKGIFPNSTNSTDMHIILGLTLIVNKLLILLFSLIPFHLPKFLPLIRNWRYSDLWRRLVSLEHASFLLCRWFVAIPSKCASPWGTSSFLEVYEVPVARVPRELWNRRLPHSIIYDSPFLVPSDTTATEI